MELDEWLFSLERFLDINKAIYPNTPEQNIVLVRIEEPPVVIQPNAVPVDEHSVPDVVINV